ncbi:helix-turn-helix domain-containing protein [Streptomyces fuscichromogenes]|nr:helix-turn-helix transcriptional regulator [Streptomyces fuscichromogenes]
MDTHTRGASSPVQRFASELRRLRMAAGNLQVKTIAARAQCSSATVSEALNGRRLPGETVTCRLVAVLGGDWGRWQALWREARTELDTLKREGPEAPTEALRVGMVRYPDPTSFYRAAAERIRTARCEVRLTYVRLHPPGHWGAAEVAEYFSTVLQWARDHSGEGASARRIIGVPERDGEPRADYVQWLREHQEETTDIYAYEARVMPWTVSCAWHNTGLVDDSVTFLSFSGAGRQQLTGFSVEGPAFLAYFADSFDQAWGALEPLDTYLARHCR